MAKYATKEKKHKCYQCDITCTEREMIEDDEDDVMRCPNCNWGILFRPTFETLWNVYG